MNIPTTSEEAKELEKKIKNNQANGDWIESVFPMTNIGNPGESAVKKLLQQVGRTRVPTK